MASELGFQMKQKGQLMKKLMARHTLTKAALFLGCLLFALQAATWGAADEMSSSKRLAGEPGTTPGVVESGFCAGPPTIDGRIGPGEWTEAREISMEMDYYDVNRNLVQTHPVKICVMNNGEELFVGLTLAEEEYDGTWSEEPGQAALDVFVILFDENDDGVFGEGEDKKLLSYIGGMSIYSDQHELSEEEERQAKEEADERQHV